MRIEKPSDNEYNFRLVFDESHARVVQQAFAEHVERMEAIGRGALISDKFDRTIATWPSERREMPVMVWNISSITDKLLDFADNTEEASSELKETILQTAPTSEIVEHMKQVTGRRNMGLAALTLIMNIRESVEQYTDAAIAPIDFSAAFSDLLGADD